MSPKMVIFLSDEYYALLLGDADLAQAAALGSQLIITISGTAYQIVDDGTNLIETNQSPTYEATSTPQISVENPTGTPNPGSVSTAQTGTKPASQGSVDTLSVILIAGGAGLLIIMLAVFFIVKNRK
jgi:hypothetical protein